MRPRRILGRIVAGAILTTRTLTFALTPHQRQLNIDSFEYVWKTIRDKHWQTKPGGLDWQSVHDELRPAIDKADTMDAARAAMNAMLARLHQTHFGIVPSDLYSELNAGGGHGESTTRLYFRRGGWDVLVTWIAHVSARETQGMARVAGLRAGEHIS